MDHLRFDLLTKAVGTPSSRRAVVSALAALAVGRAALPAEAAQCEQGCKKKGRCCGKCFEKTIDPKTNDPTAYFCCPHKSFCKGITVSAEDVRADQCCYNDEVCLQAGDDRLGDNKGNGVCCRICSDPEHNGCCPSAFYCNNGTCEPIGTARLPRGRR